MTIILLVLLAMISVGALLALALWGALRGESRASQMLAKWLSDNDFQLLQKSTPWMKDNPFFMGSNRSQKVFKVTVRDKTGQVRVGWVRCGHALAGVAVNQIEVKWNKTPVQEEQGEPRDRVLPPP